jgi:excisionase family DNA binding protein
MYNLEKLEQEYPFHPVQQWIRLQHEKKAQQYWAKINQLRNDPPNADNEFVTITEACHILHVGDHTIRKWMGSGQIRNHKVSGRRLLNLNDLHKYNETFVESARRKRKEA